MSEHDSKMGGGAEAAAEELGLSAPAEGSNSNRFRQIARRVLGALCVTAVSFPVLFEVTTDVQNALKDCPSPEIDEYRDGEAQSLRELEQIVASMDFAMDRDSFVDVVARLNQAQTFPEIKSIMEEALERYDVNIHIASLPSQDFAWYSYDNPDNSHDSKKLSVETVIMASKGVLASLSQVPSAYMDELKGMEIYFAENIKSGGNDVNGFFRRNKFPSPIPQITLDASNPEVGSSFIHELEHALHADLCGAPLVLDDPDYGALTSLNPEWFSYTEDMQKAGEALRRGIVISASAAESPAEDWAHLAEALFSEGVYHEKTVHGSTILYQKANVIIESLSILEPHTRNYLIYLNITEGGTFPAARAQRALSARSESEGSGETYVCLEEPCQVFIYQDANEDKREQG